MAMVPSDLNIKALSGVTQDSRRVKAGCLFAALPGAKADGRNFIQAAINNGASVILAPTGTLLPEGVKAGVVQLITDDYPRRAFAHIAAAFYGRQPEHIVAVTGTNGKSSTVHFVKQLWEAQGKRAVSYGTLGVHGGGVEKASALTTPGPEMLHADLADLTAGGVTHLALEASSHGLDQRRLDGVKISAAAFTNLSHDHLDYHENMEIYREAKARLFDVMESGTAVLNADSDYFDAMKNAAEKAGHKIISYGFKGDDLKIVEITPAPHGQQVALEVFGKAYDVALPLVGQFQVKNALAALGLVLAEDCGAQDELVKSLEHLSGAPGRLELIGGHPKGAAVYVDYAHTPDALESVLTALRPHTAGRLVCVFGCGGSRDRSKRPVMGEIAARLADHVMVTDDNPRSENPADIRAEILAAADGAQEIAERREAIQSAIEYLNAGDVLVIAGKGHEQGQVYAAQTLPFDDCEEARKAIEELAS